MLEESSDMEKRAANRPSSVPAKNGAVETRKPDNGSRFPKTSRKREGSGKSRSEPGSYRKPVPQKTNSFDKRPRSRGYYNDRQRDEVAKEDRAEVGSALQVGSKKANLNHLLNFTFAPREKSYVWQSWKGRNKWSSSRPRYNKEHFLQANCQFVVSENVDCSVHAADPDSLVDWEKIEQLRIFSHEVPSCPICLYPPVAGKMTRCGHIFCWPCILHYLSLGDKHWRKCPICYDAVQSKDLKSVTISTVHQYLPGQQITMKLMKRERGSTYVLPKNQWQPRQGKPHYVTDEIDRDFVKLLLATPQQIQNIVDMEKRDLLEKLKEQDTDTLEASFVEEALSQLKKREEGLTITATVQEEVSAKLGAAMSQLSCEESSPGDDEPVIKKEKENIVTYASAFDDEIEPPKVQNETLKDGIVDVPSVNPVDLKRTESTSSTDEASDSPPPIDSAQMVDPVNEMPVEEAAEECAIPTPTKSMQNAFYFYQAKDGQHIYMNSLNARCLVKEYGSMELSPDTITATIVDMERLFMTEELRNRLRYLTHLPLTCEFTAVELALKPPILSKETLRVFGDEIEKRHRLRQKKARDDRKRAKKIQEDEKKRMGIFPNKNIHIKSEFHFPDHNTAQQYVENPHLRPVSPSTTSSTPDSTPIGSPGATALNPNAAEFYPGSPPSGGSVEDSDAPMSFAQMLRSGKSKPTAVWPKKFTTGTPSKVQIGSLAHGSDDSENEDRVPVPVYQASFSDAIQAALDNMDKGTDVVAEQQTTGKKKKGKKKLLFTTTMARAK